MSSLCEGPLVRVESWPNTVCTVGHTNFMVRLDPAGMAAVIDIDPQARILPRFVGLAGNVFRWLNEAFPEATYTEWVALCGMLEGYTQFYDCVTRNLEATRGDIYHGAVNGFVFEVDVRKDSPLVGWFLVLGVNRE